MEASTKQYSAPLKIIGESDKLLNLEEKRFFLRYWGEQMSGEALGVD